MKDQVDFFSDLSRSFLTKKEYQHAMMDSMSWTRSQLLDRVNGRVELPYSQLQRLLRVFGLDSEDLFRNSDQKPHFQYV